MKRTLSSLHAALALALLIGASPALSESGKKPPVRQPVDEDEDREREVAERPRHLRARDQATAQRYGTKDLRDVLVRAAELGGREVQRERKAKLTASLTADGPQVGTWTSIGPTSRTSYVQGGAGAENNDSGTLTAIATHPTDPQTIFIGSSGGGVWKTTDGGNSWRMVTEDLGALGILQIGAVAIAPSRPERVYAGTGAADSSTYKIGDPNNNVKNTIGVLISDGGGEPGTWKRSASSPADYFWALNVDPGNPDVVLAAGDQGLQRSTDGGDSWTAVFTTVGDRPAFISSLSRSKSEPQTLFATAWRANQAAGVVIKSTDGGQTWTPKMNGIAGSDDVRGRIQVAVAPSNGSRVYALISAQSGQQIDLARSDDGGENWQPMGLNEKGANILGTQGFYSNVLNVDPANADVVYGGGLDLWRSTDGGQSFTRISHWYQNDPFYLHADQHAVAFGADGTVYVGCDGGIFRREASGAFRGLNRQIVTFMFDGICVGPDGSVHGGAQDNGPNKKLQGTEWVQTTTGDGYACLVHPQDPTRVVSSVQEA